MILEGESWCSGKVVPWWLVGHEFESGNRLSWTFKLMYSIRENS